MIDLGKPLGTFKGVTFYGDHEDGRELEKNKLGVLNSLIPKRRIVYYLPNKIGFSCDEDGTPKVSLLRYEPKKDRTGNYQDGTVKAGGLFTVSVKCFADHLDEAIEAMCTANGYNKDMIIPAVPDWEDGKVRLFILEKDSGSDESSVFVANVVGSTAPSLTGEPTAIFHAHLNEMGADMIESVMRRDGKNLVGFECELEYPVMLPAVDIYMKADLNRCQTTTDHYVDANFNMQYYVDLNLATQLEWLTKKMEENGDIVIDVLSPVTTTAEQEAVDKLTKEFKEMILQRLFEPVPDMGDKVAVENKKNDAEIIKSVADSAGVVLDAYNNIKGVKGAGKGPGQEQGTTPVKNEAPAAEASSQAAGATRAASASPTASISKAVPDIEASIRKAESTGDAVNADNAGKTDGTGNGAKTGGPGKGDKTGGTGNGGNTGGPGKGDNTGGPGKGDNIGDTGNGDNTGGPGKGGNTGGTGNGGNTGDTGNGGNTGDTGNSGNTGGPGGTGNAGNAGGAGNTGNTGNLDNPPAEGGAGNDYVPSISPNTFKIGVTYRYKKDKISFDRDLTLQYMGRTAKIDKIRLTDEIGAIQSVSIDKDGKTVVVQEAVSLKDCVFRVDTDELFKKQEVTFRLKHDFDDADNDLDYVDVRIWKKKDVVLPSNVKVGTSLDLSSKDPYETLKLTKDQKEGYVCWTLDAGDEPGYYYDLRYVFAPSFKDRFDKLAEYEVPPAESTSAEIILRPEESMYYRNYPIDGSTLDFEDIEDVEVTLSSKKEENLYETIHLNASHQKGRFIIRSKDTVPINVRNTYRFKEEKNPVTLDLGECLDDEIQVCKPTYNKTFHVLVSGADDTVEKLYMTVFLKPKEAERSMDAVTKVVSLSDDDPTIKIPFYSSTDQFDFEFKVKVRGKQSMTVPGGSWKPGDPMLLEADLFSALQQ